LCSEVHIRKVFPVDPPMALRKFVSMSIETGVIAAAGKGTRAYPRTSFIPKPLFRFGTETLLERNFILLTGKLKLRRVIILIGHLKDQVSVEIENLRRKYPRVRIETALWTEQGLAADVASLRDRLRGPFVLILGDECYLNTNHEVLKKAWEKDQLALIAIMQSRLISSIRKNYSVKLRGNRVLELIEKPRNPPNRNLGLGTYVFDERYFEYFDRTGRSARSGIVELTDVIDHMAQSGRVDAVQLKGEYFNINSLADYYAATYALRSIQFDKHKISIIIPARNNAETLPDVLEDFRGRSQEIIVLDLGSTDETAAVARRYPVKVVSVPARSLFAGEALIQAFDTARGDILVMVSADGSFRALDLPRFLEYLKDCDLVIGTRTTRQLIEQGANLPPFYRWLNVFLGKVVELLWWSQEPRYTDIGCVYRAFWKESYLKLREDLTAADKTFLTDMMIQIMRYHMRCIEIPVSYYQTYGETESIGFVDNVRYLFSVLGLIFRRRFFS